MFSYDGVSFNTRYNLFCVGYHCNPALPALRLVCANACRYASRCVLKGMVKACVNVHLCMDGVKFSGVEFMWDSVIEAVDKAKNREPGSGCILAHCMGLGKTLSVSEKFGNKMGCNLLLDNAFI